MPTTGNMGGNIDDDIYKTDWKWLEKRAMTRRSNKSWVSSKENERGLSGGV